MSTFSRYTFKDTFPNITVLTWCILGALDWMCRVSFSTQSFFSSVLAKPLAKKQKNLSWQVFGQTGAQQSLRKLYLYISWRERLCCLPSSRKSVIVMTSGWYNVVRRSLRCAPVCTHRTPATCADPANTHFLCFLVNCYGHQCQILW